MPYRGFQEAQEKYDNECPPEFDNYEDYFDSEGSSSCDSIKDDDVDNYMSHLEELYVEAIERDYQRFLDKLFNTKE